jgi:hypothetical protein
MYRGLAPNCSSRSASGEGMEYAKNEQFVALATRHKTLEAGYVVYVDIDLCVLRRL